MRKLTTKEKSLLCPFFSNLNRQVFVLTNMPEVLKGALLSRYSRSPKGLRELFLDEYLGADLEIANELPKIKKAAELQNLLNSKKAAEFYRKWLSQYGDDSIAELGGAHLAIEGISIVAAKVIEERRIGLSPLEKSTRYVRFDNKIHGHYLYYHDAEILKSRYGSLFTETMDGLFDTYSHTVGILTDFFQKKFPREASISEKAYAASIRAKACDHGPRAAAPGLAHQYGRLRQRPCL